LQTTCQRGAACWESVSSAVTPRPHSEFLRPTEIALGPENPPYPSRHARAVIAGRMRPF